MMNIWERIKNDRMYCLVVFLMMIMLLSLWGVLLKRDVFVFDDMMNLSSYSVKLAEEGRWINYLAFWTLRWLNGTLIMVLNLALMCLFCFRVARNLSDSSSSILITLFSSFALSFYYVSDCPITLFTMYLFGAMAAILHDKMNKLLFFIVFGILFCGVVSPFYFLLPLLFLRERNGDLLKVLLYWILGYIVGFCVAELAVFVRFGHFIELAAWRKPMYVTDWNSLCENASRMLGFFFSHLRLMGICGIASLLIAVVLHIWNHRHNVMRGCAVLLVFLCVVLSAYAQALPCGIIVSPRTSWGLFLGSIFAIAFATKDYRRLQLTMVLVAAASFFAVSSREISRLNEVKDVNRREFERLDVSPTAVQRVVFLTEHASTWSRSMYGVPFHSVIETPISLGFRNVVAADRVYLKKLGIDSSALHFNTRGGYSYAISHDILVVKINPEFYKERPI